MRKFRPTLLAGALALALTAGTASAQFTNTYIFGESDDPHHCGEQENV